MRLISERDLLEKLREARDTYKDSTDPIECAIRAGLDRAITETVLMPTEGRK